MFIELVDALRCPRPHEDSWLVLRADTMRGRHVEQGALGCPICRAEYDIRDGEVLFGTPEAGGQGATAPAWTAAADAPLRLAALLGLMDVRAPVVLCGRWCEPAERLADSVAAPYLLVNPPVPLAPDQPQLSVIRVRDTLSLAPGGAHAVALDAGSVTAGLLESAARAVRAGGRLLAPGHALIPAGFTELARDEELWVAERDATAVRVPLRRRGAE